MLLVDGAYGRLKPARMEGTPVYYGEMLSEHTGHTLETQHLSHVLCATENDFYNALVCKAMGPQFGHHRAFQLATDETGEPELRGLPLQQRGFIAFDPRASFDFLGGRLAEGWQVQATKLTKTHGWPELSARLGEPGQDWLLLGGIGPTGSFRLYSKEQKFRLEAGWTALYFAPVASSGGKSEARMEASAGA